MKPTTMKTRWTLLAALTLSTTAATAVEPSLFDLSLQGIVVEQCLVTAPVNLAQLSLHGIVVDDVLMGKTSKARHTKVATRGSGQAAIDREPSKV